MHFIKLFLIIPYSLIKNTNMLMVYKMCFL